jgi:hypothetical protein
MNRLVSLPRGFGSFPVLEVLDLSYNNLNEESLPGNFWIMQTLRALYLRYDLVANEFKKNQKCDLAFIYCIFVYNKILNCPSKDMKAAFLNRI